VLYCGGSKSEKGAGPRVAQLNQEAQT